MAISGVKEILKIDPRDEEPNEAEVKLSFRADEIDIRKENVQARQIISELKRTIRKLGITALSAPAIGYNKRIFCIDFKDNDVVTFINPIIAHSEGIQLSKEQCTSIPDKKYIRIRNNKIQVIYQTPTGEVKQRQMVGLAAYVFQHEVDHLDGLLLSDIGLEIDDDYEQATDEEKSEIINAYLDCLDIRNKELQKEIEEDPDLKQTNDAIKFMTAVATGEVQLERFKKEETAEEEEKADEQ